MNAFGNNDGYGMDGYRVEPDQLRTAANDIGDAIGAADDTNLEDVPGDAGAYGHGKVADSLKAFCTTWELAKQILQQRSASAGEALVGCATVYEQQEENHSQTFDPAHPEPSPSPGPAPTPTAVN
ncbi:WXG100 family type VII secretion target [Actinophytocola gossypii]|uniref:Excreted virulence factor EspC, type VII ESX diderm n=1 Tax=Actinophytocola gossypii TaxID=2812003 RepID=A0ABT2J782_9PSEU|nr:hypothetical protein [Actinophytocola gossypii]MCT2583556.1 hypothetical protein [Actinophytocola gossypii]